MPGGRKCEGKKMSRMKKRKGNGFFRVLWHLVADILVTVLCLAIILLGVVWVFEKGPSPTLTAMFCRSVRETSALRWMPGIFLSSEEQAMYLTENTENAETAMVNTSLIRVAAAEKGENESGSKQENLELVNISYGNCKGKLLIVHDPKTVTLGISGNFTTDPGLQLTEMVEKYHGIAGTNAGGFIDNNGLGNGGQPSGLVIYEGEIVFGSAGQSYNVIGLDRDGILHVGTMTGQAALDAGVYSGVSFVTHDGIASSLIINGEVQRQNLSSGVNPRTAIGQREDGALLLLVLDGRSINTLGATMENEVDILLEYGAVNAGNLDGGSSSVMVYDGKIINHCASVTGPRGIPTAFIVLGEE